MNHNNSSGPTSTTAQEKSTSVACCEVANDIALQCNFSTNETKTVETQCNFALKLLKNVGTQTEGSCQYFDNQESRVLFNIIPKHLVDHNYSASPSTKPQSLPTGTQNPHAHAGEEPMLLNQEPPEEMECDNDEMEISQLDYEDGEDYWKNLSCENESDIESDDSTCVTCPVKTKKFIVFDKQLDKLFKFCHQCGVPVIEKQKRVKGCMLTVQTNCLNGHTSTWDSQPSTNRTPVANLLIPAAILFSGCTYASLKHFSNILNLQFVSEAHFYHIQTQYLFQVVNDYWSNHQQELFKKLKAGSPIDICGDGRCDSPGHSAKYGTYTMMHEASGKVIDFSLVQVSEVTSSNAMEYEACKRSLDKLLGASIPIRCLTTDRHVTITAKMRSDYPHIVHQYDVWHLSKSITKKLLALAKRKFNEELAPWIKSVSNHLWWSVATCNGDPKLLIEKWLSIINHVSNKHEWRGCSIFTKCEHHQLTEAQQKEIKWLKPGSSPHVALEELVTNPYQKLPPD